MNYFFFKCKAILLLAAGALLAPLTNRAQADLNVKYYDDTEQTFSVLSSGKLYFDNGNMIISTSDVETPTSIPISLIRRITFLTTNVNIEKVSNKSDDVSLFPNPSSDYFQITTTSSKIFTVNIYSLTGQQLSSGTYTSGELIAISYLAPGMYIIKIDNKSFKFLKQ